MRPWCWPTAPFSGAWGRRDRKGGRRSLFQHLAHRLSGNPDRSVLRGQIITFTFPHIGNVGANYEDLEATTPAARGLVIRNPPTEPANYRAEQSLDSWLRSHRIIGLCGVDTRRLTRLIRDRGAPNGVIAHAPDGRLDLAAMRHEAQAWPGLDGMDLARDVTAGRATSGIRRRGGAAPATAPRKPRAFTSSRSITG